MACRDRSARPETGLFPRRGNHTEAHRDRVGNPLIACPLAALTDTEIVAVEGGRTLGDGSAALRGEAEGERDWFFHAAQGEIAAGFVLIGRGGANGGGLKLRGGKLLAGEPVVGRQGGLFVFIVDGGAGDVDGYVDVPALEMGGVELDDRREFFKCTVKRITRLAAAEGEGGLACIDDPWRRVGEAGG